MTLPEQGDPLTDREVTILRGVAQGHPNKRIGTGLGLSADTVKGLLSRSIYRKLDAADRAHAVSLAYQAGILRVTP